MMDPSVTNPGPVDPSVLYDQDKHVSSAVWDGQERGALRCHEHTSKLSEWKLTRKQIELVERAGFGYLRKIPAISLDNPLISALVERWRRETNTFHFTVGEMTVTLRDVALLLGLAIDGKPVIGLTYTSCSPVCEKYLGRAPDSHYASGGMVKLSWLKEFFSDCPEDAPLEEVERRTRAYILYLVGSTIFSTTTGNKVPVMYLPLFENFDEAGTYAWGAAALAFLYRALGNASVKSQSTICGCLTLLQCWSYYHLDIGRPKLNRDPIHNHFPFVLRWKGKQSGPTTNRDVVFYRKALDSLKPSEVKWLPYADVDSTVIPDEIKSTLILGRSKTMLICFDKAERHLPDRCLRQYGYGQPIPEDVPRWVRKSRGVDGGVDLSAKMEPELNEWAERRLHIVDADNNEDEGEYMRWYWSITRRVVGRPISLSTEFQMKITGLKKILEIAESFPTGDLDITQVKMISEIISIADSCLRDQIEVMVEVAESPQTELGKRTRGKERVRRKGTAKRRKGVDPMEDQGPSEDESQYGPVVEVDQLHLPLAHTTALYDGEPLYDAVPKVDVELCDEGDLEIPQPPNADKLYDIDDSVLGDENKTIEVQKSENDTSNDVDGLQQNTVTDQRDHEMPTTEVETALKPPDVKEEDKESHSQVTQDAASDEAEESQVDAAANNTSNVTAQSNYGEAVAAVEAVPQSPIERGEDVAKQSENEVAV